MIAIPKNSSIAPKFHTIDAPELVMKSLPKTNIRIPENLPESPGIYFVCDSAYRVRYVGIATTSLRQRHQNHEKFASFIDNGCDKICFLCWNNIEDITEWEPIYIDRFRPHLNDHYLSDELPIINFQYSESQTILRYKEIQVMEKALEEEKETLKPDVVTYIERHPGKFRIKTEIGEIKAHAVTRPQWGEYSKECYELEDRLKALKKQEQESGVAKIVSYITYPVVR